MWADKTTIGGKIMKKTTKWIGLACAVACSAVVFAGCKNDTPPTPPEPNYLEIMNTATDNSLKNPTLISDTLTITTSGVDSEIKIEMIKYDSKVITRVEAEPQYSSSAYLYVYDLADGVTNRLTKYDITRSGLNYETATITSKSTLDNGFAYILNAVNESFADVDGFKIADITKLDKVTDLEDDKYKCEFSNEYYGDGITNTFAYTTIVNNTTDNAYVEQINVNWTYTAGAHHEETTSSIAFNYSVFNTAELLNLYAKACSYSA